jgi:hypothetical protein
MLTKTATIPDIPSAHTTTTWHEFYSKTEEGKEPPST